MRYQQEKFINALLFFGKKTDPKKFGITKLLKLLFFSDFLHFKKYGRPILGDTYFKLPQGPVPTISYNLFNEAFNLKGDAKLKKVARIIDKQIGNFKLGCIEPLKNFNLDVFSDSDIKIMEQVAKKFYDTTGTQMVKDIHKIPFIKNNAEGIKIDYKKVLKNENDRDYTEMLEEEEEKVTELLGIHG